MYFLEREIQLNLKNLFLFCLYSSSLSLCVLSSLFDELNLHHSSEKLLESDAFVWIRPDHTPHPSALPEVFLSSPFHSTHLDSVQVDWQIYRCFSSLAYRGVFGCGEESWGGGRFGRERRGVASTNSTCRCRGCLVVSTVLNSCQCEHKPLH